MPHLSMSDGDAAVLRELLEAALLDLRREISHTDSREFRGALHQRQLTLERLLQEILVTTDSSMRPDTSAPL